MLGFCVCISLCVFFLFLKLLLTFVFVCWLFAWDKERERKGMKLAGWGDGGSGKSWENGNSNETVVYEKHFFQLKQKKVFLSSYEPPGKTDQEMVSISPNPPHLCDKWHSFCSVYDRNEHDFSILLYYFQNKNYTDVTRAITFKEDILPPCWFGQIVVKLP